jgi:hypothetical protein
MAYVLRPITGTGIEGDPFRPDFPAPVLALVGFRWTASIPRNAAGVPLFADCYVWIPDSFPIPPGLVVIPGEVARGNINQREPKIEPGVMELMP